MIVTDSSPKTLPGKVVAMLRAVDNHYIINIKMFFERQTRPASKKYKIHHIDDEKLSILFSFRHPKPFWVWVPLYVIMSFCEESGVCGILCLVGSVLPHPAHSNNRQQLCRLLQESALEKRGFWPPLNSFKQKLMKRLDYLLVDPLIAAR